MPTNKYSAAKQYIANLERETRKTQFPVYMKRFKEMVKKSGMTPDDFFKIFCKKKWYKDDDFTDKFDIKTVENMRTMEEGFNGPRIFLKNIRDIYGQTLIKNTFYDTIETQPLDQVSPLHLDPATNRRDKKMEKRMSLADRKATAEKEEAQKNKIPTGVYSVRLKDWQFGKSQKGADMYTLTWKLLKVISLENEDGGEGEDLEVKGKERKTRYLPKENWSILQLLNILEEAGADLGAFEEVSDIDTILEEIEDTKMPRAKMTYENVEGKQYPNIDISDVEGVLAAELPDEEEEEDEDDAPAPPLAKKKKYVKSPKK
ncbi:MAG: hypothetical protein R6V04_10095 [bacterium]